MPGWSRPQPAPRAFPRCVVPAWRPSSRELAEAARRVDDRGGLGCDLIVVAAQLVGGMGPAIGLAFDQLLEHAERGAPLAGTFVLQRAGDSRHARELDLLREL